MQKEIIQINQKDFEFEYDENWIGRPIEDVNRPDIILATLEHENTLFSLVSNGSDGEHWLEITSYTKGATEDLFSDAFYEVPKTKEDAKEMIIDWFNDEINDLTA